MLGFAVAWTYPVQGGLKMNYRRPWMLVLTAHIVDAKWQCLDSVVLMRQLFARLWALYGGWQSILRMLSLTGMTNSTAESIVTILGGRMVSEIDDCTHLVTDKMRRTIKFLCAVSRGVHIVTPLWLIKSGENKRWVWSFESFFSSCSVGLLTGYRWIWHSKCNYCYYYECDALLIHL